MYNPIGTYRQFVKYNFIAAIDDQVGALTRKVHGNVWECIECGKTASQRTDLRKHIEAAHLDLFLPCEMCGMVFKSRHGKQHHSRTVHNIKEKY